jgi:5-methylcytosine-specific restriction endonuclease McrA
MKNYNILVLNKFYFPIAIEGVQKVFGNIFSGSMIPLDIVYEQENGCVNIEIIEYFTPVSDVKYWLALPIRDYDEYIQTCNGPVRIPSVVICAKFDRVMYNKVQFPTKLNIYKRDNYTCMYTNKKLSKDELSVDHVIPKSRGGKDTWDNLVCCDRLLNSKKGSKSVAEMGLKLKYKPYKPTTGMNFEIYKDEWASFLKNI